MWEPQDTFQKRQYGDTFKSRRRVAIPPLAEARGLLARCIMIMITGALGFLGTKMWNVLRWDRKNFAAFAFFDDRIDIFCTDRESMDITDAAEVMRVICENKPEAVIHLAAMTDVDKCESAKDLAYRINVDGTKNIIEACKASGAKLVFMSTDFVFDGMKGGYSEDDAVNPVSYYGETKRYAEELIRESGIPHLILRTGSLYGYNGGGERSFVMWALDNMLRGQAIRAVSDQFCTPTLTDDVANAVRLLLRNKESGTWHVCGPQRLSKYEMALHLADEFGFDRSSITPVPSSEFVQAAQRPRDSSMCIAKLTKAGVKMHSFDQGLKIMKKQERDKN